MRSDSLFSAVFAGDAVREATSDDAWLRAMLDVEAALARAGAATGLVPRVAAVRIVEACRIDNLDRPTLVRATRADGNPVIPLVSALRTVLSDEEGAHLHRGATSQDILDTAAMLVAARAIDRLERELLAVVDDCADLADEHRETVMVGRTLLQPAVPITFGLKAASWTTATLDALALVRRVRRERLAVQLGGAAGTLAALDEHALAILRHVATELDLAEPVVPWHTTRARVVELGSALALVSGTMGKIGLDLVLLAQHEVAEVLPRGRSSPGGSSTMPNKRNPIAAISAVACARQSTGAVAVLFDAMLQEHERAAGAWHAEWEPLNTLLTLAGGAAERIRESLEDLEVDPVRMRANLDANAGLLGAEALALALAEHVGRPQATEIVHDACRRAIEDGRALGEIAAEDRDITAHLDAAALARLLDPTEYLGATDGFITRALAAAGRE